MIYIGLDDTDMPDTRGTGNLARIIADSLTTDFNVMGVVRHQLFFDPCVPFTAKNSSASIILDALPASIQLEDVFERVRAIMQTHFIMGSDPGLAVSGDDVSPDIVQFGQRAKKELVTKDEAQSLAAQHGILLEGLGGTNGGMIGALSSIGLTHFGSDGRYIQFGSIRDLVLPCSLEQVHQAGIQKICTIDNQPIASGTITGKNLRPARRDKQAVLFVETIDDNTWQALKIN